ncbi:MAG: hypothetical protein ACYSU7_03155 [Planctomycetota bacterium]
MKRLNRILAVGMCTAAALSIGMSSPVMADGVGDECVGDIDGDGITGISDLIGLIMSWGPCPDPPDECPADLDDDSMVGCTDLLIMIGDFGCGYSPCENDGQCDDGDPCTIDKCFYGLCVNFPDPSCD